MKFADLKIDKRRRTYVRLIGEIQHALNQALSEEKAKRGLNKTQIAKMLGLGRSAISKKFDGRHNMTLETLADLAYALDRPVKISLPARDATQAKDEAAALMKKLMSESFHIGSAGTLKLYYVEMPKGSLLEEVAEQVRVITPGIAGKIPVNAGYPSRSPESAAGSSARALAHDESTNIEGVVQWPRISQSSNYQRPDPRITEMFTQIS